MISTAKEMVSIPRWFDQKPRRLTKARLRWQSFNSTMVRSKAEGQRCCTMLLLCFNSTMVRSKGKSSRSPLSKPTKFQFHDGSIKRFYHWHAAHFDDLFQFHDGSIKSAGASGVNHPQFKVSIPRWFDQKLSHWQRPTSATSVSIPRWFDQKVDRDRARRDGCNGFNSTMVRSKASGCTAARHCSCAFQFHDGSIKSAIGRQSGARSSRFQFHDGSIKRLDALGTSEPLVCGFNSTMVRSKASV